MRTTTYEACEDRQIQTLDAEREREQLMRAHDSLAVEAHELTVVGSLNDTGNGALRRRRECFVCGAVLTETASYLPGTYQKVRYVLTLESGRKREWWER